MRSQTPERAVMNAYTPAAARTAGSREQKAWSQAQNFEQVFLNTMFGQMFTGIGTDCPSAESTARPGAACWSMNIPSPSPPRAASASPTTSTVN